MDNDYKKSTIMKVKKRIEKGRYSKPRRRERKMLNLRISLIPYVPGTSSETLSAYIL